MLILPTPRTLTERFALLIRLLCDAVAVRSAQDPYFAPVFVLIHSRLQRLARRFAALVARFEAGTLRPPQPRPSKPRAQNPRARPAPYPPIPTFPGWLALCVRMDCAAASHHLRHLLERDPEMRALLEAAPQLGRLLRPLWSLITREPRPPQLPPPPPTRPAPVLPDPPDAPLLANPA